MIADQVVQGKFTFVRNSLDKDLECLQDIADDCVELLLTAFKEPSDDPERVNGIDKGFQRIKE